MTIEQYLYRLCRNILNERFDWRKYLTTRSYFGRDLCVTPLHVSYGQIGYTIHFPYSRDPMPELAYDWEMDDLTIDEEDWQKWLSPEEDDEEEEDDYEPEPRCRPVREQAERRTSSAPAKRRWKIILEDIDSWEKYSFTFCDSVGIGRGKDGSMYERYLPLTSDGRISKLHCVIIHKNDKLYVKDEDSRNGTYLNGVRIDRPMEIQRDDIIGVGETRLEVQRILRESD